LGATTLSTTCPTVPKSTEGADLPPVPHMPPSQVGIEACSVFQVLLTLVSPTTTDAKYPTPPPLSSPNSPYKMVSKHSIYMVTSWKLFLNLLTWPRHLSCSPLLLPSSLSHSIMDNYLIICLLQWGTWWSTSKARTTVHPPVPNQR
jgi:hypothetical protein